VCFSFYGSAMPEKLAELVAYQFELDYRNYCEEFVNPIQSDIVLVVPLTNDEYFREWFAEFSNDVSCWSLRQRVV